MQQPFCLACCHFLVCMKVIVEGRKQEIWNGNLEEFYKKQAEFCDYWGEDQHIKKELEKKLLHPC